jgi:hypothetical protein
MLGANRSLHEFLSVARIEISTIVDIRMLWARLVERFESNEKAS